MFFETFEPRANFLASWVELQRGPVLLGRFRSLALRFVQPPKPFAGDRVRRPVAAFRRTGEIRFQILLGMRRIYARNNSEHSAIIREPRIVGRYGRSGVNRHW